ncbi:MAG: hypothetical protein RLZZ324_1004 [Candidatus Parcubacteria bacterium]
MKAASAAVLFSMLALPASAHGLEIGGKHGFSFNFGGLKAVERMLTREVKKSEKKDDREERKADSACIASAKFVQGDAVDAATDVREAAQYAAVKSYFTSLESAFTVRASARASARTAFLASAKDDAAKTVYASAKLTADTNWSAAKTAAQTAWFTARTAADAAFRTAKAKADADLAVAKAACITANPTPAPVPTDVVAPGTVTTLSLSGASATSMTATWTAKGDDGTTGTATSYDLRRSTTPIVTDADFNAATQVTGEPVPMTSGTSQSVSVTGLTASTTYYFALKVSDEAGNVSALSNVASLVTLAL